MDTLGYKSYWNEEEGEIPEKRINVAPHIWDMSKGEYFFRDFKYPDIICKKIKNKEGLSDDILGSHFVAPPYGDVLGHMVVKDATVSAVNDTDNNYVPVMPNYVRDLAGRVVCIAECFPVQNDTSITGRFPINSFVIDENYEGFDLLENVFFSQFRTLDVAFAFNYSYKSLNLHPYKLRVDTFYQDGWKIPQTEMLFIKSNTNKKDLDGAIEELSNKWKESYNKGNYERFYEEVGGEEFFESLFQRGVTLIPTLEAYNANSIVDRDFNLVDFYSGKVVGEFHDVVSYQESELPIGTIIKVVEYGYITEYETKKAKVIVSNGSLYKSLNSKDPDPLCPNLKLPHSRITSKWGDVYIPTHPKHFESPLIWGWNSKTGFFSQEKGPIWDPLHYYYESVDLIIYNFQGEVLDENYWFYNVPEKMKMKFYPVIPLAGVDILDAEERKDREKYLARPYTECKRISQDVFSTGVGYHPMPAEFEVELDSWFMPELAPSNRVVSEVPLNIRDRLAESIVSNISVQDYIAIHNENTEGQDIDSGMSLRNTQANDLKDYPYLARYLQSITSIKKVRELMLFFFVEDSDLEHGSDRINYLGLLKIPKDIDTVIPDMSLAYYEFKDNAFNAVDKRLALELNHQDDALLASWNSTKAEDLFYLLDEDEDEEFDKIQFSNVAIMQPPTF